MVCGAQCSALQKCTKYLTWVLAAKQLSHSSLESSHDLGCKSTLQVTASTPFSQHSQHLWQVQLQSYVRLLGP